MKRLYDFPPMSVNLKPLMEQLVAHIPPPDMDFMIVNKIVILVSNIVSIENVIYFHNRICVFRDIRIRFFSIILSNEKKKFVHHIERNKNTQCHSRRPHTHMHTYTTLKHRSGIADIYRFSPIRCEKKREKKFALYSVCDLPFTLGL